MITVVKRNGRIEPLDITKIQKYTKDATDNLEGLVILGFQGFLKLCAKWGW
ncbi:hypothetical protein V5H57_05945 [Helicobacter pylori]